MDEITIRPASSDTWTGVEALLSQRGPVHGCWCMYFRQTSKENQANWGDSNRRAMKRLVDSGRRPGLVAFRDGRPIGWVSVAPRAEYTRLDRSPVTRQVDEQPVWSLVCLYVSHAHRGTGVARLLVRAAVDYARERGAEFIEAYPVDDTTTSVRADAAYHGVVTLLRSEGFEEVARRRPNRPVMRRSSQADEFRP
jgi:GNAT superfamily N-acetyltransferase